MYSGFISYSLGRCDHLRSTLLAYWRNCGISVGVNYFMFEKEDFIALEGVIGFCD